MKDFFTKIPGFRSDTTWKKVIAIIYYIMTLISMVGGGFWQGLVMLSMPFLIFSGVDLVRHRDNKSIANKALISCLIAFAVMVTGAVADSRTNNKLDSSPAQEIQTEDQNNDDIELAEAERKAEEERKQKELEEQRKKEEEEAARKAEEEQRQKELEEQRLKEEEEKRKQEEAENANKGLDSQLKVHYIDVGQGDCILIHTGHNAMLIDTGNKGDGSSIVNYIKDQGINRLDYLILTHPHADHIGGASDVINALDIDKILMPKASHTTQTFENLLLTIQDKGHTITSPSTGDEFSLGDASFTILASNQGSDLNDKSIVNRLTFGNTSFMFTGDAESPIESQILSSGYTVKSDVLKVGHHGSDTSTTSSFLSAVSPKYAVISVGQGNKYGHPDQPVLDRLVASKVEVYRTDESGTIIATSDGKTITFDKKASPVKQNAPPKETTEKSEPKKTEPKKSESKKSGTTKTEQKPAKQEPKQETKPKPAPDTDNVAEVYVTNTGKKYHRGNCRHLSKSKIPISLKKAKSDGYEPCKTCSPPN